MELTATGVGKVWKRGYTECSLKLEVLMVIILGISEAECRVVVGMKRKEPMGQQSRSLYCVGIFVHKEDKNQKNQVGNRNHDVRKDGEWSSPSVRRMGNKLTGESAGKKCLSVRREGGWVQKRPTGKGGSTWETVHTKSALEGRGVLCSGEDLDLSKKKRSARGRGNGRMGKKA